MLHTVVIRPDNSGLDYAVVPLSGPIEDAKPRERFSTQKAARAEADKLNAEHLSPAGA
jgi:hypothetical protein